MGGEHLEKKKRKEKGKGRPCNSSALVEKKRGEDLNNNNLRKEKKGRQQYEGGKGRTLTLIPPGGEEKGEGSVSSFPNPNRREMFRKEKGGLRLCFR